MVNRGSVGGPAGVYQGFFVVKGPVGGFFGVCLGLLGSVVVCRALSGSVGVNLGLSEFVMGSVWVICGICWGLIQYFL